MTNKKYSQHMHSAGILTQAAIPLQELRSAFPGQVIAPQDAGYDQGRALFYGGFDNHPQAIVRPVDADGVRRLVSLAGEAGLSLAVRSGGHSLAGFSIPQGGLVLDLKNLRGLQIDAQNRTAWAETGLTAAEFTQATNVHGLATGFGDTGSVGIGGITLGGGIGYLVRKYGLTIDDLLAAEVVTADGQLRRVDADHEPDLFWALRGGGGNFGVATRFQYRLHPLDMVMGGMLILPATPEVVQSFIALAEAAPEELGAIANVMAAPPMPFLPPEAHGKLILMAFMVYAGDVEAGERAIAPFRLLAQPIADMLRPMHYPEIYPPEDESYHPTAVGRTIFIRHIEQADAERIIETLKSSDASMRVAQLRVLGGAMSRVPVEATAFAHRTSRIMMSMAAFYDGPDDKPRREAWVKDFAAAMDQGDPGAYVNFMGENEANRLHNAYPGSTWERLVQVKSRYDPTNMFRHNQNIPSAAGKTG